MRYESSFIFRKMNGKSSDFESSSSSSVASEICYFPVYIESMFFRLSVGLLLQKMLKSGEVPEDGG